MDGLSVIDHFLDVYSRYIDSGFGLLGGEVAWLSATLIAIDMTLAGLFWAMAGDEVIPRLLRKVLYVGAFAFIIGHFNALAGMVFRSFAGLGLLASGNTLNADQLLQPGRLAAVGVDAGRPIMEAVSTLSGFPEFFLHFPVIAVLLLAWLLVIASFFILALQLFVTLIEFKLTTLAGFVLVPFALWGKTAFLAERVLGNVVCSGVKVLVLAVIVGIGSTLFAEFHPIASAEPTINDALAIVLASLSLLALGIFGPGIATGLVMGAPQLGAGAAAGAAMGAAGLVAGSAGIAMGGARLAASTGRVAVRAGTSLAPTRVSALAPGLRRGAQAMATGTASATGAVPAWAQGMRRHSGRQGVLTTTEVLRSSPSGGLGASPQLHEREED